MEHTHTYTLLLLDIRPLSLNLHTLIANPKLPGIMLSLSNQNVKTQIKLKKTLGSHIPNPPLESCHPQQTSQLTHAHTHLMTGIIFIKK